jgi:hypothetical protein
MLHTSASFDFQGSQLFSLKNFQVFAFGDLRLRSVI